MSSLAQYDRQQKWRRRKGAFREGVRNVSHGAQLLAVIAFFAALEALKSLRRKKDDWSDWKGI